jgi:transposase InsO family protein
MAAELGIAVESLSRWTRRERSDRTPCPRGRPEAISPDAREKLRECYLRHFKQWGPQVLRQWARRSGLGNWSASTIAAVVDDLRDTPEERPPDVRYEIVVSNVMWSEDGTGFKVGKRKKELIVAQDEHARFKVGHELVEGPADEDAVCRNLETAFARYGAPLVLKHDGGSIFHGERIRALLKKHRVTELTGPRCYPQYNGKKERSMRDIKSFERAMRRHGPTTTLGRRIDTAIDDLNYERPRPVLGGRTAREAFEDDRIRLPDRNAFIRAVNRLERKLYDQAASRIERDSARRRAVEGVLLDYRLMRITGDVSHNFEGAGRTK